MSYTSRNPRYRNEPMGAVAALPLTVGALVVIAAVAAVLVPELFSRAEATAAPTPAPTAVAPAVVVPADAPAMAAVRAVTDGEPTWGSVLPVPFGCDAPQPVVSGSVAHGSTSLGAFVVTPGAGAQAMEQVRRCGRTTRIGEVSGARFLVDGGQVFVWSRGDVLVSVAAPTVDPQVVADVDARLRAALDGVCVDLEPSKDDTSRNPLDPGYRQWHTTREVSVPSAGLQVPSPEQVPAPTAFTAGKMPSGVPGPPAPAPVPAPSAGQHPGAEPLTTTFEVPAVDEQGPGCGWAFTGATGPVVDRQAVAAESDRLAAEQLAALQATNAAWVSAARAFVDGLPQYQSELAAWEGYVAAARDVESQWAAQAAALDQYRKANERRAAQARALEKFNTDRAAAQTSFDEAVRMCAVRSAAMSQAANVSLDVTPTPTPTTTPTPAPTPTPTAPAPTPTPPAPTAKPLPPEPAGGCPAARPGILDQAPPSVDPEPAPPTLWQP